MRVDLAQPLRPGQTAHLSIKWSLPMIETKVMGGRSGYVCFKDHIMERPGAEAPSGGREACIFQAGQWFPRLAAYDDQGWHNDPFLGAGEFPLEFGDYDVAITAPADDVVAATGELQNPSAVLTFGQRARLAEARSAGHPIFIVTPEEARAAVADTASGEKTWVFKAVNVRDFAFASSRMYLWDAMGVSQDDPGRPLVMVMSFYPDEARPLWSTFATEAMAHTLKVYGQLVFPYPYPVVQATFGAVGGFENPMLSFVDEGLPHLDAKSETITYAADDKISLVNEVIHETGHNWFPEIVNSDERRWAWMDEGIDTFLEYEAVKAWSADYPTGGEPRNVASCMTAAKQSPIMVRPDYAADLGCAGYVKPGSALAILRETVMGREAFDRAFREYAIRWRFKRATPYDFFRTMQDASGVDLAWFWRGWFYGTNHVDVALDEIVRTSTGPVASRTGPPPIAAQHNTGPTRVVEEPSLRDFYDPPERGAAPATPPAPRGAGGDAYRFTFTNLGGLVTPIPLKIVYDDGSNEMIQIPVQVWRHDSRQAIWAYATPKAIVSAEIDPAGGTGDTDRSNKRFPRPIETQSLKASSKAPAPNPMQAAGVTVTQRLYSKLKP